jgi:hypothetical protein
MEAITVGHIGIAPSSYRANKEQRMFSITYDMAEVSL